MAALSLAAVVALIVFLLVRSHKNPLFLAGGAAFLGLGRSTYINIVPDQTVRQVASVSMTTGDVLFAALVLGWVYARRRRPILRTRLSSRWMVLGVCVAFFLALELALALTNATSFHPVLIASTRDWFYIPLGFFLTLDVLRRFTAHEIAQYVSALSLLTTSLMALYIAQALRLPVYPYPKFLVTAFSGTTIIRDFTTFPIWTGLAWAHYLSRPKGNAWVFAALAVLATGTLLTYSRSTIVELAAIVVLAVILQAIHQGRRASALVVAVAGVALLGIFLVGGPVLVPAQYGYLGVRFGKIDQAGQALSDPNLQSRIKDFGRAQQPSARVDHLLGAGLFDPATSAATQPYRIYNSYDSDWIRVVYRTGWAGVAVLAMPLVLAIIWGVGGFLSKGGSAESDTLLLTGVLVTVFSFAGTFTGLGYFWWPALSLFPVALVAYATGFPAVAAAASNPARLQRELGRLASGL